MRQSLTPCGVPPFPHFPPSPFFSLPTPRRSYHLLIVRAFLKSKEMHRSEPSCTGCDRCDIVPRLRRQREDWGLQSMQTEARQRAKKPYGIDALQLSTPAEYTIFALPSPSGPWNRTQEAAEAVEKLRILRPVCWMQGYNRSPGRWRRGSSSSPTPTVHTSLLIQQIVPFGWPMGQPWLRHVPGPCSPARSSKRSFPPG